MAAARVLEPLLAQARSIIFDPRYHDLLAIVKGFRAGLVYGVKVRAAGKIRRWLY